MNPPRPTGGTPALLPSKSERSGRFVALMPDILFRAFPTAEIASIALTKAPFGLVPTPTAENQSEGSQAEQGR